MCCACFSAGGPHLALFELNSVKACPIHSCALVEACPDCHRPFRQVPVSHYPAHCGCDLRFATPPALAPADLAVSNLIASRIDGSSPCQTPSIDVAQFDATFGKPGLGATLRLLDGLGGLAAQSDVGPAAGESSSILERNRYQALIAAGCSIAMDWPFALYRTFDSIAATAGQSPTDRPRIRQTVETSIAKLGSLLGPFAAVQHAFSTYLTKHQPRLLGPGLRPRSALRQRHHDQLAFDLGPRRRAAPSDQSVLAGASRARGAVPAQRFISVNASARRLALPLDFVRRLAREGLLETCANPVANGHYRFRPRALAEFIEDLTTRAATASSTAETVDLVTLLRNADARGLPWSTLFRDIKEGAIASFLVAGSKPPLARLRFASEAMDDLVALAQAGPPTPERRPRQTMRQDVDLERRSLAANNR